MITFRESCKTIFAYENDVYLGAIVLSDDIEYERYKDRCNGDKLLKLFDLKHLMSTPTKVLEVLLFVKQ